MTITSNISTVTVSNLPSIGKVIFLSDTERNTISSKLNQVPWQTVYNTLTSDANSWKSKSYNQLPKLFSTNHLFTTKPGGGYGGTEDYLQAVELKRATYALGLKYAFTGDTSYADKLIDCIYRWCIDSNTYMNPNQFGASVVEDIVHQLGVTMSGVYCAAGLIWNYWDTATSIGQDGRQRKTYKPLFIEWIRKNVIYTANTSPLLGYQFCHNKTWSRLVLIMSGAIMTNDTTKINDVIARFKSLIDPNFIPGGGAIGDEGCIRNDAYRVATSVAYGGLVYSLLTMNNMTAIAEMAKHYNDTNLFTYPVGGRSFKLALDLYTKYGLADNPATKWKTECCKSKDGYVCSERTDQTAELLRSRFALYEIANYRFGDIYKNVINKRGRPMNNVYIFGYDTLMHGI